MENDLTAIGIFGLQDPLREDIADSIMRCRKAGLTVIMCTGDNLDTAKAISVEAGIIESSDPNLPQYTCMTGKDFREEVGALKYITTEEGGKEKKTRVVGNVSKFRKIKQHLRVLARSSPEDKLLLVTGM